MDSIFGVIEEDMTSFPLILTGIDARLNFDLEVLQNSDGLLWRARC